MNATSVFQYPFGEISCEHEVLVLGEKNYQNYYYSQSRFTPEATDPGIYLIVGRRGSGKTSLARYLNFQTVLKNASCIDVDEPEIFNDVMLKVASRNQTISDISIHWIAKVWEYVIWSLILNQYKDENPKITAACVLLSPKGSPAHLIADILKHLLSKWIGDDKGSIADEVEEFLTSKVFEEARDCVLDIAKAKPIIVAIDTIERYDKDDMVLMGILAGLIQCANKFNIVYSKAGIHIKSFIAAEIFPHLKEDTITNTTKHIRYPLYMHWRPKDLIRLVCWRFYKHMEHNGNSHYLPRNIIWEDFNHVLKKMWFPFFGERLLNFNGIEEKTFPYILRHTQMRPRQLVYICNHIAKKALEQQYFPQFFRMSLPNIVNECERDLADEVLNSYARIYDHVAEIVDALRTSPIMFEGKFLDKKAHTTASAWPRGEYSPDNFRRLVAELGIVGRVRSMDNYSKVVAADFEYAHDDRLALRSNDMCVIHPMFYSKLDIARDQDYIVFPFPDHPDFDELNET